MENSVYERLTADGFSAINDIPENYAATRKYILDTLKKYVFVIDLPYGVVLDIKNFAKKDIFDIVQPFNFPENEKEKV